ncbi:MAG: GTPase ObgE [Elusimicrobia bacterium]|nr:GTPase ObgE [Elusimicrobiota bacterium]
MAFIDTARISLKAGSGGDGCLSFRREKYVPYGGPNGGDGGRGGSIYLVADPQLSTLMDFAYRPHWAAPRGKNGQGKNCTGASGEDLVIPVPCGTWVKKNGDLVADLLQPGRRILAARGGRGGRGNTAFKSNRNKAPRIVERGEAGEVVELVLELKLFADAGLVGLPNAGKSSLLARLSHAKPKIADYPFTTLGPLLGAVRHKEKSFVLADIPGLIEGAHKGKGLGDAFLRHLQRARILIHVVDPFGFMSMDALRGYRTVAEEVRRFHPDLAGRPRIVLVNKMDLPGAGKLAQNLKKKIRRYPVFFASAATGEGLEAFLDFAIERLAKLPKDDERGWVREEALEETSPAPSRRVIRLEARNFSRVLKKLDFSTFHRASGTRQRPRQGAQGAVVGKDREKWIEFLKTSGLERELKRQGIREGDTVEIGGAEFEWIP